MPAARSLSVGLAVLAVIIVLTGAASCGGGQRGDRRATEQRPTERSSTAWTTPQALPRSDALPADQLAYDSDRTGNFELFVMPAAGGEAAQLTNDPVYDSWSPRVSPDRRTLLFYRTPKGVHDRDYSRAALWAVAADGTDAVELRPAGLDGWGLQGHAEWSPDGGSLVMFGGGKRSPQLQLTDALGQAPRPLTDRPGQNLDPAFSPDGRSVVFTGCPRAVCFGKDYEIYKLEIESGETERVTDDQLRDHDPMYSPDGDTLAWLTAYGKTPLGAWDVRVRTSGDEVRRLVGDDGITSRPQFSTDGRWIFVHRIPPGGKKFDVFRVRPDGSELTNLTAGQPGNNEYPSP